MSNVEAGITILVTLVCLSTLVSICSFVDLKRMREKVESHDQLVARMEHALTQSLAQLTSRASAAEALSRQLMEENRILIRQQVTLAPDSNHRAFLESQVEKLQLAMATSADMANARIMSLLNTEAAGQVHAQQIDRDPVLRSTRRKDGFTEEPPPSAYMDTIDIPAESPRRTGEARVTQLDPSRFDRPGEPQYHPEEELAGVGLDAGLHDAAATPVE
jgi:hypothetical protein